MWVRLEGMNPGGSIKDRTALAMIVDAEERGALRPGQAIVEPTSGNTGIGLAQVAAARGYPLKLCLPSSMSMERKKTLRAYGAELVLTDPELRMLAAIEVAEEIRDDEGAFLPDQFSNPANPRTHYEDTGPELWHGLEQRIDAFVYGSGTGGTISGVGRKEDAFPMARRLAREEGLFVGMSSGAIIWTAVEIAKGLGPGHRVACIAPDSASRYLTTELFEDDNED